MPLAFEIALKELAESHRQEVSRLAREIAELRERLQAHNQDNSHAGEGVGLEQIIAPSVPSSKAVQLPGECMEDECNNPRCLSPPSERGRDSPEIVEVQGLEFAPVVPSIEHLKLAVTPCIDTDPREQHRETSKDRATLFLDFEMAAEKNQNQSQRFSASPAVLHGLLEVRKGTGSVRESLLANFEMRSVCATVANIHGCDLALIFRAWSIMVHTIRSTIEFKPVEKFRLMDVTKIQSGLLSHLSGSFQPAAEPHHRAPSRRSGTVHRFTVAPSAPIRLCWDICGALLLLLDVIMIPLAVFTSTKGWLMFCANWVALLFWTFDMVASCLTGYAAKGVTIMSTWLVILHYLKTWFVIDLIVLIPDWAFALIEIASGDPLGEGSKTRLGVVRVVRMLRVLRLLKFRRILTVIKDRIDSEEVFIFADTCRLVAEILICTHFVACLWYAIGDLDKDGSNWIDAHDFRAKSVLAQYSVSYHWCLAQFTPGSMEVHPHNILERIFNIIVLIIGLFLFSGIVSTATRSLTRLQEIKSEHSTQLWLLRRFLRQNSLGGSLSWRVLRYAEFAMFQRKHRVPSAKVWVLKLLSAPLQRELTFASNFICLRKHPFFEVLHDLSHPTMHKLTIDSLSEHSLAKNDRVFAPGLTATSMYMVQIGELAYHHSIDCKLSAEEPSALLWDLDWACEAALWVEWYTLGTLVAIIESKLICVHPQPFTRVVTEDSSIHEYCIDYANNFSRWLSETRFGELKDVAKADEMITVCASLIHGDYLARSSAQKRITRSSLRSTVHSMRSTIHNTMSLEPI